MDKRDAALRLAREALYSADALLQELVDDFYIVDFDHANPTRLKVTCALAAIDEAMDEQDK